MTPDPNPTAAAREQATKISGALERARSNEDFFRVVKEIHAQGDAHVDTALKNTQATVSCRAGCYLCCHKHVEAVPLEVFRIAEHIRQNFSPERVEEIRKKAKSNADKVQALPAEKQRLVSLLCPLVDPDGKCSVYSVRPLVCRREHSMSFAECEEAYKNPESFIPCERLGSISNPMGTLMLITSAAFSKANLDARPYHLSSALVEALDNQKALKRWRDGKRAFSQNALPKDWSDDRFDSQIRGLFTKDNWFPISRL